MKLLGSAAIAALSLGLTAPAALALDFGNGFSIIGDVELEYANDNGNSGTFLLGDVTLGWRGTAGIGVDFNIVTYSMLSEDYDESSIWGGLVLETSFGEVTVGRPRPLMASISSAPNLGASGYLSSGEYGLIRGSYVDLIVLFESEIDIYGITLEGEAGALSYGIGVHSLSGGSESANAVELTARYKMDNAEIYGGIETIDLPVESYRKVMLGGRYMQDRWSLGAEISNIAGLGPSQTFTMVYGEYLVLDSLTLGLQVQDFGDEGVTLLGLSGAYTFGIGGFAEVGYVSNSDGDHLTSASIGVRF